jgi:hypothetical protein
MRRSVMEKEGENGVTGSCPWLPQLSPKLQGGWKHLKWTIMTRGNFCGPGMQLKGEKNGK